MATFPMTGVEIRDGLPKMITSNKYAVKQDNQEYSGGLKSSVEWKHEETDLLVRVIDTSMSAVIGFLEGNKQDLNRYITPGYTPFNRTSTDNYGYNPSYSKPKSIGSRFWEFSIHIIWQPTP